METFTKKKIMAEKMELFKSQAYLLLISLYHSLQSYRNIAKIIALSHS